MSWKELLQFTLILTVMTVLFVGPILLIDNRSKTSESPCAYAEY